MSRKKLNRRIKDHNDMLTKAKRVLRSRARIAAIEEALEELGPDYEEDFYDIWHDWDREYDL